MAPLTQEPFTLLTRMSNELKNISLQAAFTEEHGQGNHREFAVQSLSSCSQTFKKDLRLIGGMSKSGSDVITRTIAVNGIYVPFFPF
ncbi:MAG TPA: hypothetical protein PKY12_05450, partial [Catalimonadaceae bacterium]|nr:hypothetical protein [Catalimonadaceae bacterium]